MAMKDKSFDYPIDSLLPYKKLVLSKQMEITMFSPHGEVQKSLPLGRMLLGSTQMTSPSGKMEFLPGRVDDWTGISEEKDGVICGAAVQSSTLSVMHIGAYFAVAGEGGPVRSKKEDGKKKKGK